MAKKFSELIKLTDDTQIEKIVGSSLMASQQLSTLGSMSKFGKVASIIGASLTVFSICKGVVDLFQDYKNSKEFTVTISDRTSPVYAVVESWLYSLASPEQLKDLTATFTGYSPKEARGEDFSFVAVGFDSNISADTIVDGHPITIESVLIDPETSLSAPRGLSRPYVSLVVVAKTHEGFKAVIREIDRRVTASVDSDNREPKLYIGSNYGDFSSKVFPPRPAESVILAEGVWESIRDHVKMFTDNESKYNKLSMPYHTGLILHGPPGTGKTSVVSALSTEFSMDVYHISLKALDSDSDLVDLFTSIPKRSLILLEDIDVATSAVKDREESSGEPPGITLAGLLNVLDGNLSPYGSVIIMTTNALDSLDPAISRPGRTDLKVHLNYVVNEQLERICKFYLGHVPDGLPEITADNAISSAQVTSMFRNYINDMSVAEKELIAYLQLAVLVGSDV